MFESIIFSNPNSLNCFDHLGLFISSKRKSPISTISSLVIFSPRKISPFKGSPFNCICLLANLVLISFEKIFLLFNMSLNIVMSVWRDSNPQVMSFLHQITPIKVRVVGFEPTQPKQQIYSLPQLSNFGALPVK